MKSRSSKEEERVSGIVTVFVAEGVGGDDGEISSVWVEADDTVGWQEDAIV